VGAPAASTARTLAAPQQSPARSAQTVGLRNRFAALGQDDQRGLLRDMPPDQRATALAALPSTDRMLLLGSSAFHPEVHDTGPAFFPDWNALKSGGYDPKTAWAMAVAAKRSYEPFDPAGPAATPGVQDLVKAGYQLSFLGSDATSTQAFVAVKGDQAIVAFRGTEPGQLNDLITDGQFLRTSVPGGEAHSGFNADLDEVWPQLQDTLDKAQGALPAGQTLKTHFTGHSLGAALATLAAERVAEQHPENVGSVYTFGSPRVFDAPAAAHYQGLLGDRTFRFENNADLVAKVPPEVMGFQHVGTNLYFDHLGNQHVSPSARFVQNDVLAGTREDFIANRVARQGEIEGLWDHGSQGYVKHVFVNANGPAPRP
jgi:triacylglycerol lipase